MSEWKEDPGPYRINGDRVEHSLTSAVCTAMELAEKLGRVSVEHIPTGEACEVLKGEGVDQVRGKIIPLGLREGE